MKRSSGILMHIASLPSPYGIGTLGTCAYAFADFLKRAGQQYWQVLPLGHTGFGDSPYQVFSMYAGNPYFIDLDQLVEDGLLKKHEPADIAWGEDARRVDYGALFHNRYGLLRKAYERGKKKLFSELEEFRGREEAWLEDYALFMALKVHFGMHSFTEWEEDARLRSPEAMMRYSLLLQEAVDFFVFLQYLFFKQFQRLRDYVHAQGIRLIGDLPIYVAPDSADVWSGPECFLLDAERRPTYVAGVPPDYFSKTGQLWGNPLYNWDRLKKNGYKLWMDRFRAAADQFDVIRIDHFRGIESYWKVPYGEVTALNGAWEKGPGLPFVEALKKHFPDTEIIAEDLGDLDAEVISFVRKSGLPGMKVLQFAFDSREASSYLPHAYNRNCVCYTGTHDNTTAMGWLHGLNEADRRYATAYLGLNEAEGPAWGLVRGGMGSPARLFMAQMQDYLELPAECRMNTPSTLGGNWRWRMLQEECTDALGERIGYLTEIFGRQPEEASVR